MNSVYRKTAKGTEAIANRALGVSGRLRSLLIFVDGKRSEQDLSAMASGFGDVPQMLAQLVQESLIEVVGGIAAATATQVAAATTPATTAASPAVAVPLSVAQAKTMATRLLMEILGPSSEPMCLHIEAAKSLPEYVEAVKRAYALIHGVRGAAMAERFGNTIEANLPQA